MKRSLLVLLVMFLAGAMVAGFVLLDSRPSLAQEPAPQDHPRAVDTTTRSPSGAASPDLAAWTLGPPSTPYFDYYRFDGVFVPGPDGEPWANKVYFLGGRNSSSTEDSTVWMFDPVDGTYTDTGADVVEDVSNYHANLVMDDGTGNGPAIYIIGGYDADNAVANIGTVQRYYPMTNVAEALGTEDDWTVTVADQLVTAMGNAVVNDIIYVFGGWENVAEPYFYDGTWAFDPKQPAGSRWTDLGVTVNPARSYFQIAIKDNLIYAMGGISEYVGGDLVPTTVVEVFDPANPGAGWTAVTPMPVASAEGRGFGFDSDTLGINSPWGDKIYVAGGGDWSANTVEVMEYDAALDYWNQAFPDLINARRDHAGVFVPLCTADPTDGLPGMWVFGGQAGADNPPYAPTEYYPMECPQVCNVLLVDDDWDFDDAVGPNDGGLPYYTSALDQLGYTYDTWVTVDSGDPTLADLQGYSAVVWFTGYAWDETVFTATNEADVGAYLDAGGNFLLSAQEYLYSAGGTTPFMANYLGVDTYVEDVIELDPIGTLGNPVGDGLGPFAMVRPDDFYTYWPTETYEGPYDDYIYAAAGFEEPFYFNTSGQPNSTNYDSGTFKTIYMAWPFEWIDTVDERADILDKALSWFCAPGGAGTMELIPPAQSGSAALGEVIPYTLTILNDLGYEDTFDIAYDSVWDIDGPATVGPVANGASADFVVEVTVPLDGNCFDADTASILASAQSDPLISDTAVLNSEVSPAGLGDLTGVVLDANTSAGIEGALVDAYLGDLYYFTHTDADGNFVFPGIEACTFTGSTSAFGYYSQFDWEVMVVPASSTAITLTLDAAMPLLTPDTVSIEIYTDTITTTALVLENMGTGDLNFHITELISGTIFPIPDELAQLPAGVDQQVYDQIAASPEGQTRMLVYMREEADLSRAFSISDRSERGWYVLNSLRRTADRSQADLRQELDRAGIPYESYYLVNALVMTGGTEVVNLLASHPDVAYVGADVAIPAPAPVEVLPVPDAPEAIEWNISQIEADQVWTTYDITGTGIVVSNIDTGVQWDHPALINQYRGWDGAMADHNYNWWDPYGQSPLVPNDADAHGTHTMGTMVGDDGGTNQIGVAPGAQWFACDGFDDNTGYGYTVELLECAEFILAPWDLSGANADPDLRPDVVNNSWGGGQAQWWYNQAIYAWRAAGIFPVFSAGNAGPSCETTGDPGDMANIMAVGATNNTDTIASFSSRGPAAVTGITKPNVSAPGVNIRSSVPGDAYESGWNGTSMAAPHVAGTAALIWAAVPELRGDVQVTYWILEQSAFGITTDQGCGGDADDQIPNNVYGWGRINALDAVELAMTDWEAPWLAVDPLMGTVAPDGTQDIDLTFDSTGMEVGACSYAWLKVEYNDPYTIEQFVPVEMCVVEQPPPVVEAYFTYLPIIPK
jgi:hypothetical protein